MVGYQQNDTMTPHQKLIAGCISGVTTRFITQPLDVVKIRTQLQKKQSHAYSDKWFSTTRKIFAEEGITAFWHGHNLGQIHSILSVSSQFYVYELSTKFVSNASIDDKFKPFMMFCCGSFAGGCSAALVIPLEVVRVRQMIVKEQYRGFFNGAKKVYKSGGIFAFYEGLSASLLQMGPAVGISFSVFRMVQQGILHYLSDCSAGDCKHAPGNVHRPEYLVVASTLAGSVSGFVSKSLTYPFDLAKRRLQIATHKQDAQYKTPSTSKDLLKCKKLTHCLVETYKSEGFTGLYRGWKVTIYKAQLTSVVAFTTYELICYAIREFDAA
ncbi:mitochondrial thiamine pyrophosphate carrier-like isoform X1 [Ostrinia nubilalis]|uniref:mitochondrial thiamine pyrophosphate carrier-like isoform X2 n=1 Tax=Ostrinia furnacalis TaxID=93504 RepID=UPI00103C4D96|nr:mitochondrial thiamine pyrophosphate carrier-like isoform X2 [Ostrinia furnacalis]